jgi:cystathionine gamma-synthase
MAPVGHRDNDDAFHQVLGRPLPLDEHACSVSLPTWDDVVGYEEGDPEVSNALKIGYPRFKIHSSVERLTNLVLFKHCLDSNTPDSSLGCMVWPTRVVAEAFQQFLGTFEAGPGIYTDKAGFVLVAVGFNDLHGVVFPANLAAFAKKYWQHTGEVVSSRQADAALLAIGKGKAADTDITPRHSMNGLRRSASDSHMLRSDNYDTTTATVRERIARIVNESPEAVTLCVSGMAAIFTALKCVLALIDASICEKAVPVKNGRLSYGKVVVFGFPYLDTLKVMQTPGLNPLGHHFFGAGDEGDLDQLEAMLRANRQSTLEESPSAKSTIDTSGGGGGSTGTMFAPSGGVAAVFTEFPSNPLLKCPNLQRLSRLAAEYGFLLVVDDTVGNFANTDLLHSPGLRVDMICTSLTKMFSGRGDVLAGSLIVNSYASVVDTEGVDSFHVLRSRARFLKDHILTPNVAANNPFRVHVPPLFKEDATTLEVNSRTFLQRSQRINRTALALAQWLAAHPTVDLLYYPNCDAYDAVMRRPGVHASNDDGNDEYRPGYSSLMSIILVPDADEKVFFDSLEVCKGPSLGTNFTIACPYTLLAHYTELEWAAGFGVNHRLVRVSVGLESLEVDVAIIIDNCSTCCTLV